jgi:Holliday junction DNA helicase RuvA
MIAYLKGTILDKGNQKLILDVQGVGYEVFVNERIERHLTDIGSPASFYIYHHIREDFQHLYGFQTQQERALFVTLLSASGVGPKTALSVMSAFAFEQIVTAIRSGDSNALSGVSGVGRKTVEKLMVELQDKIAKQFPDVTGAKAVAFKRQSTSVLEESFESEIRGALASLGYKPKEIDDQIQQNIQELVNASSVEDAIKHLLKGL